MWNYRLVRKKHEDGATVAIHEVYYDENMVPHSVTVNAVPVYYMEPDEDKDESLAFWLKALQEAYSQPILDYDDIGSEVPGEEP
jgi:hypothetical protein